MNACASLHHIKFWQMYTPTVAMHSLILNSIYHPLPCCAAMRCKSKIENNFPINREKLVAVGYAMFVSDDLKVTSCHL